MTPEFREKVRRSRKFAVPIELHRQRIITTGKLASYIAPIKWQLAKTMHSLSCFDAQVSKECAWLKISTQIATSDTDTDLSTFSWLSVQEVNSVSASCHFVASATQEKCIIACFLIVRNRIQAGNLLNKQQCSRQSELIQHPVSLTRT